MLFINFPEIMYLKYQVYPTKIFRIFYYILNIVWELVGESEFVGDCEFVVESQVVGESEN